MYFIAFLRIGVNYGDVTSGVIGNTKLYYDIWGDAVNIASRWKVITMNFSLIDTRPCSFDLQHTLISLMNY